MMNGTITINNADYKNIFIDIAEKLYTKHLIDSEERVRLLNIINKDKSILKTEN